MTEDFQNQQPPAEDNKQQDVIFPTLPPLTTAFIAMFGIFLLYQIGGAALTLLIFGLNFENADVNAMRLLTMGGQILFILLPTLILARTVYHKHTTFILRMKFPKLREIGLFLVGLILLLPILQNIMYIQNFIIEHLAASNSLVKKVVDLLDQIDKLVDKTYGDLLTAHSVFEGSFIIFVVAVIPALCEETLFRGLVQKSFEMKLGPLWGIIITALFFGLYHFNPYGLIPLIILGIYFGYAAYLTDSIFVSMAMHFTNNFLSVVVFMFLGDDELVNTPIAKNIQIAPHLISFVVFSALFFSYIFFVKKFYHKIVSS